jgi:hypothetical protein
MTTYSAGGIVCSTQAESSQESRISSKVVTSTPAVMNLAAYIDKGAAEVRGWKWPFRLLNSSRSEVSLTKSRSVRSPLRGKVLVAMFNSAPTRLSKPNTTSRG